MSRVFVMFDADEALPVGKGVRLLIDWPAQLEKELNLTLELRGRVVQADGARTTVAIFRYEFRIRSPEASATAE